MISFDIEARLHLQAEISNILSVLFVGGCFGLLLWKLRCYENSYLFLPAPNCCIFCVCPCAFPITTRMKHVFQSIAGVMQKKERIRNERGIFDVFDVNNGALDINFVSHCFRQYSGSLFTSKSSSTLINSGFLSHCKAFWLQIVLNNNSKTLTKEL